MESPRTNQPIEILIVDDEPQAVKYFKKAFGTKYDVLTATSADEAEALVLSGNHNIALVITDQRMPGRSGVSLLNRIRNERPEIVRMLTTAYADLESAIEAVNKGEILRYITKPWDLRVLEAEIEQAITFYLLKNEYDLLLRDKLSALHRTLLRDRMNGLAAMAGMLPFNNASMSMYRYLKDALAETAWRNPAQKQWSQLRLQDHWRVPIDETQRAVALSETLLNKGVLVNDGTVADVDLVAAVGRIAEDINQDYGSPQVNVVAPSEPVIVAGNAPFMQGILQRLVEPVSRWAAPGSTLQVSIKSDKSENGDDVAQIGLESRNCEPSRSMNDCVLFAPALTITPPRASEFLRATMAVGHIGGDIHSPPMENGFKQVHLTLPSGRNASGVMFKPVPRTWLQDLNDAYEKWVMGTLDLAH